METIDPQYNEKQANHAAAAQQEKQLGDTEVTPAAGLMPSHLEHVDRNVSAEDWKNLVEEAVAGEVAETNLNWREGESSQPSRL